MAVVVSKYWFYFDVLLHTLNTISDTDHVDIFISIS